MFPFFDSITNWLTSLGTSADKSMANQYRFTFLDRSQLDFAYRGDWVARKVVDIPPFDATREWRSWQAEAEDITAIEETEKRVNLRYKLRQALAYARLYGAAALVIGDGSDDPAKELNPRSVSRDGLRYVHVMHRYNLSANQRITNINDPYFGEPESYRMASDGMLIHPSRVIRFIGAEVPDDAISGDNWGGDPVLLAIDDAVKQVAAVSQSTSVLVQEATFDFIKIPGLSKNITTAEYKQRLSDRLFANVQARSVVRAIVGDAEEEWQRIQTNFSGLPDLLKMYLLIVSGAADIPATRMLGQSPAGLSATGESDVRNYYDRISAEQNVLISPRLDRLDEVLIRSALGDRPPEVHYLWNSLWQMTPAEKATISKTKADTFKIDLDAGLIPLEVLREARVNQLTEDGTYPGLELALEEFEELQEEVIEPQPDRPPTDPGEGAPAAVVDPPAVDGRAFGDYARRVIQVLKDAKPRTLYVRRDVLNAEDIIAWAKAAGFETAVPADQMHVTIAYSRQPVDWLKLGDPSLWMGYNDPELERKAQLLIRPGGARLVERLGPTGEAVVLMFTSSALSYRHHDILCAGASWDFEDYQPHITISWDAPNLTDDQLRAMEPYRGEILLGPEVFEEIDDNFRSRIVEDRRSGPRIGPRPDHTPIG